MTDPDMAVPQHVTCADHDGHDAIAAGAGAWAWASGPADAEDPGRADAALRIIYQKNAPGLLSYVTGLLGDRYLAEDVVQETMLRVWRHRGQFSAEKGSVQGWLVRVAHNIAMDKLRMRRARPTEVADSSAPEPQVADHADAVVTALHIQQMLARLSPGQRNVIEQVYLNGLTAAETAALLGIPEGTVFSRVHNSLRLLRQELGMPSGIPQRRERRPRSARTLAA